MNLEEHDKDQEAREKADWMEKALELCEQLEELGESTLAHQLFNKVKKEIHEVELEGDTWLDTQICLTFPAIDRRCLVFCCTPKKPCPFRQAALELLGVSPKQYRTLKKSMTAEIRYGNPVVEP